MEWTGAKYADGPTVEVETWIDAPPQRVWEIVSDITLMPEFSDELRSAHWLGGATRPAIGNTFLGSSAHPSLGEWSTTSHVIECDPLHTFAWAVSDPENPTATWRFTLDPRDSGTMLRQWVRMGPARSGLSRAIDAMPDKEEKIVFVRMREFETAMTGTLAAIKARAEARC
ncbi:SRPBCC family protein [Nocardia sp. NEAU-G5]|uniref:SRPBCC family protein n=1 Tax=Nocardia albiluteola TaxID=2842303 RepID=A0ABS6B2I2_9NOCA|nr:SRPBCC family protein [Nocardia albiluteola]MBU3064505.1 SRPBCC family protein [Nocardia albiluteola]